MRVAVVGAGRVGVYLGGHLHAGGHDVVLVGRDRLVRTVRETGVRIDDVGPRRVVVVPGGIEAATDAAAARGADVVLVTVKSHDTTTVAQSLAAVGPARVVSLQNGISNTPALRRVLPQTHVVAGTVPFNVVSPTEGVYRRTTSGPVVVGPGVEDLVEALGDSGIPARTDAGMDAVQRGKLVMNLNNALNALSGRTLLDELADRGFRTLLADAQVEAIAAFAAAGQEVRSPVAIPLGLLPRVLRLPDPVFGVVARRSLAPSPEARSSMWDDLAAGRPTEVDALNGAIVELADAVGTPAPVNRMLVTTVHRTLRNPPAVRWSAQELRGEVTR